MSFDPLILINVDVIYGKKITSDLLRPEDSQ